MHWLFPVRRFVLAILLALAPLAFHARGGDEFGSELLLIQAKEKDKQPPTLPPTVVPGETQPGTPPTPTPPTPPPPTPGPFGPGGAFNRDTTAPFLPDVQGTQINAGKKTENIDLRQQPPIANNNLRQALITVPSLYVAEESSPLVSIGYRGLNPDRAQFMMLLRDGIPIAADIFGYPESYYIPPFQTVERIDFIHGGSSLMYGPQPGGALNFITKMPPTEREFQFYAENAFGSFNYFSTYENVSGTSGPLGYYFFGLHRQSDGFRDFNNRYDLNYGGGKTVIELSDTARLIVGATLYSEGHGEPGGLTFLDFEANPNAANRPFDFFQLRRHDAYAIYQEAFSEQLLLEVRTWGVYYSRFSKRQRGGGFGTAPAGATSTTADFQLQEFYTFGIEPRVRFDYDLFGGDEPSTFTFGTMYYHNDTPRTDSRGPVLPTATATGLVGTAVRRQSDRQTDYLPVFAENLFRFGDLLITPGIRLENIWQANQTNVVPAPPPVETLTDLHVPENILLLGIGMAYKFTPEIEAYTNYSQAYRPITFADAIAAASNTVVPTNLAPSDSWQTDIGFRGRPAPYLYWDTSLFYLDFSNQIGTVTGPGGVTVVTTVGSALYRGWEYAGGVDFAGLTDALLGTDVSRFGAPGAFFNTTVLHSVFYRGFNYGGKPAYTPDYIIKSGFTYTLRRRDDGSYEMAGADGGSRYGSDLFRLWFTGTFVDLTNGQDDNANRSLIPPYTVWDLTGELALYGDYLRIFGGIYNVFDRRYFSRTFGNGIDPAYPRNYYAGFKLLW